MWHMNIFELKKYNLNGLLFLLKCNQHHNVWQLFSLFSIDCVLIEVSKVF